MICPANCADMTLTPNPTQGVCDDVGFRERSIYKLGIYLCSDPLPTPLSCASLEALVDSNAIVFTSPLADVTLSEPETEDVKMNDCDPAVQRITGRTLTFTDKYKIVVPDTPGPGDKWADLTFWGNKKKAAAMLRFVIVYCDMTLEIPKDEDGNPASSTFMVYRNFQEQGSGANSYRIEVKQGSIRFKGDPLGFSKPDLDLTETGCESLAQKIGFGSYVAPTT